MEVISEGGLLRKDAFEALLTRLGLPLELPMPGRNVGVSATTTRREKSFVLAVFATLDRSSSGEVDVCDLIIALSALLYTGSKSEKLAFAFDLLDENGDGRLTRRNLWRFFRCFIATILLMACPEVSPGDFLQILADEAAAWVTSRVFSSVKDSLIDVEAAHRTTDPGSAEDEGGTDVTSVSFDEIAEWYSSEGCHTSSWIELLNISKWVTLVHPDKEL